jgi:hypothetical protein
MDVSQDECAELGAGPRTAPAWVAPAFAAMAVAIMPWVGYLALTLPKHVLTAHYRLVWVGFDIGLIVVLGMTAYLAWRGRPKVALAATAAATMLVVDAWFDVLTSPRTSDLVVSAILALVAELPLAVLCLWVAWHAERVVLARMRTLARREARERAVN